MNLQKLPNILSVEPKYRIKQVNKAIFVDFLDSWKKATSLPLALRQNLESFCPLEIKATSVKARDGQTVKALIKFNDGLNVETVLMKHQDGRRTVCVSSQIGCSLNCSFCATGKMGFKRNLSALEIIEQVLYFSRFLKKTGEKVTNLVFMGMGEPFLNYHNLWEAISVLNDKNSFNLGARHISISTAGITEGINKLAEEKLQVNLAISLHAPNNELRNKLMPVNKKYPLLKVLAAVDSYVKKTNRRVMFEYLMIDGVNDSIKEAVQLTRLMKNPLYFVNLIVYNPTGDFRPSSRTRIDEFKNILVKGGIRVTERYRFGREISAACGQLAIKNPA